MTLEVDKHRLMSEIEELALISDAEAPAVTRIVFTPTDLRARAWFLTRCKGAGLAVRQDAIGNIFARWNGRNPSAAVGTGSHIDAIPNAGKYDGVVGVLGGLEAIRALRLSGFNPTRSIELILFTSEEPTRSGRSPATMFSPLAIASVRSLAASLGWLCSTIHLATTIC